MAHHKALGEAAQGHRCPLLAARIPFCVQLSSINNAVVPRRNTSAGARVGGVRGVARASLWDCRCASVGGARAFLAQSAVAEGALAGGGQV